MARVAGVFRRGTLTLGAMVMVVGFLMAANPVTNWTFSEAPATYNFNAVQIQVDFGGNGLAQLVLPPPPPPPPWWNAAWPTRKAINVTNAGAAETNSFLNLTIPAAQADFWAAYGAGSNGFDVRFIDGTGTIIPYNRVSFTPTPPGAQSAVFKLRVPSIPAGASTIYVYYGNIGAPDGSQTLLSLVTPGGVADTWNEPMDYALEFLTTSQWATPSGNPGDVNSANVALTLVNCPGADPVPNDEGCPTTSMTSYFGATNFPYYGSRYASVQTMVNGCAGVGIAPNCRWQNLGSTTYDANFRTGRRIDVYGQDQNIGDGGTAACTEAIYRNAFNANFAIFRWCGEPYLNNGANQYEMRLFRNGNIQFDYGPNISGTYTADPGCGYPCPPVVGISRGNNADYQYVAGYNRRANTSPLQNANSVIFRAYGVSQGSVTSFGAAQNFGGAYSSSNPAIDNTPVALGSALRPAFTGLYSFAATIPGPCNLPTCAVTFQISPNGTTWYWYNAGSGRWVSTVSGYTESNDAATVNTYIGRFMRDLGITVGAGFTWRAFLHSDGTVQTGLDDVTVGYSFSRPDSRVMDDRGNPSFLGTGVFNVDPPQTASNTVANESTVRYTARVVNNGLASDTFTVLGDAAARPAEWTVTYSDGTNDITTAVENGTFSTGPLAVSSFFDVFLSVTPHYPATGGVPMPLRVLFTSTNDNNINLGDLTQFGASHDSVIGSTAPAIVRGVAEEIDADATFPPPVTTTVNQNVINNVTATYYIRVSNTGNVNETNGINVKAVTTPAVPTGWTIKYYMYSGATCTVDATFSSQVAGAGAKLTVPKNGSVTLCVLMTADKTVSGADSVTASVTATNTTDLTKTATVQAITQIIVGYQSDLSIELNALNLTQDVLNVPFGNNVYDPTGATETTATTSSGPAAIFFLRVDNDGNAFDQMKLTGDAGTAGWTVKYFDAQSGGNDVTTGFTSAGLVVGLPKFSSKTYRAEITPTNSVNGGDVKTVGVRIVSINDATKQDKVIGSVQMNNRYQPDALVSLTPSPTDFIGANVYDASQVVSAASAPGATKTYYLELNNNGNTTDSFTVTGTPAPAGWTVAYFDAFSGGNDITAAVTGAGYTTAPLPRTGPTVNPIPLRVEVTPTGSHLPNDTLPVFVTATSVGDGTKKDTVRADTVVGFIPDLWISTTVGPLSAWLCDSGAPPECGVGIIDTSGQSLFEIKAGNTLNSVPISYYIAVSNIGLQDDIIVTGTGDTGDGWSVSYFDAFAGGSDITALVTSGGWHTGSLPTNNPPKQLRITLTPGSNVPNQSSKAAFITARSSQGGASTDTVRSTTTVSSLGGAVRGLDLLIEGNGSGVQGATDTGLGGTATKTVVASQTQTYPITVNNTGTASDSYTLSWVTPAFFTIVLNDGAADRNSPYTTGVILPNGSINYTLKVTPQASTPPAQYTSILNGISTNDNLKVDSVTAAMNVVDIARSVDGAVDGNGQGITGAIGSGLGGSSFRSVPAGGTGTFAVAVTNTGNVPDSYQMLWITPPGFTVLLNDGTADRSSGYVTAPIIPGARLNFAFKVTLPVNASRQGVVLDIVSTAASGVSFDSLQAVVDPSPGGAATQMTVSKGANSPVNVTASQGQLGVRLLQLQAAADPLGNDVRIHSFQLHAGGNGNALNSITAVKLWDDANGDGIPDGPNYVAIGSFTTIGGSVLLTPGSPLIVTKGTTHNYMVTLDFATKVSKAPLSPGGRAGRWPAPAFGFLALLGLTLAGFRRKAMGLVLLAILGLGLLMAGCNTGGGPLPATYNNYTYSASIGPGDVAATDAATQTAAAVLFNPSGGFQSGTVTISVKVTP